MRPCLECDEPIPVDRKATAKTCSTACSKSRSDKRNRARTAASRKSPKVRADRPCAECTEDFTPYRDNSRFCSRNCGWLWHQREKRGLRHDGKASCTKCGEDTPRKPGIAVCGDCKVDPRETSYDRDRARTLRGRGITQADFDFMLTVQDGRCAICKGDKPSLRGSRAWSIDHCHTTGRVRGLLCNECNVALGLFRDNVDSLLAAADYLLNAREAAAQ